MAQTRSAANGRFARGYNCAQSIFAAFAERFDLKPDLALRLAAPFGAGMARKGEVCGALTGALMVIGLEYANDRPENKDQMYRLTREFIEQFEKRNGTLSCKELIGHDISTPKGMQAARDGNAFANVCPVIVDQTARALTRYLNEHSGS